MEANNDTNSQMVGTTMSGQPIFDDPFHSAHQNFSEQDHQEAAQLHGQMAQQSQQSGDVAGAAQHQSAAQSHTQQGQDSMAPGGRFMDNLFGQQGTPQVQPDDMGQFQDLLGTEQQDPMMGNPAIAGGVDPSMAQDPMMGQPPVGPDPMMADPMAQQDPLAGQMPPDPMSQPPMMDPMAQDPMPQEPTMDPMAGQMPPDPMAQDPMAGQIPPGPEMGTAGPMAPVPDMGPGPIPGMEHSATGGPVGPQTDVGMSAAQPAYDIDALFDDGPDEEMAFGPDGGGQMDVPESNAGFPGPDAGYNEDPMMGQDPMAEDPMAGQMPEEDPMMAEDPMAGQMPEEDPMMMEEEPMDDYGAEEAPPVEDEEDKTYKAIAALRRYV